MYDSKKICLQNKKKQPKLSKAKKRNNKNYSSKNYSIPAMIKKIEPDSIYSVDLNTSLVVSNAFEINDLTNVNDADLSSKDITMPTYDNSHINIIDDTLDEVNIFPDNQNDLSSNETQFNTIELDEVKLFPDEDNNLSHFSSDKYSTKNDEELIEVKLFPDEQDTLSELLPIDTISSLNENKETDELIEVDLFTDNNENVSFDEISSDVKYDDINSDYDSYHEPDDTQIDTLSKANLHAADEIELTDNNNDSTVYDYSNTNINKNNYTNDVTTVYDSPVSDTNDNNETIEYDSPKSDINDNDNVDNLSQMGGQNKKRVIINNKVYKNQLGFENEIIIEGGETMVSVKLLNTDEIITIPVNELFYEDAVGLPNYIKQIFQLDSYKDLLNSYMQFTFEKIFNIRNPSTEYITCKILNINKNTVTLTPIHPILNYDMVKPLVILDNGTLVDEPDKETIYNINSQIFWERQRDIHKNYIIKNNQLEIINGTYKLWEYPYDNIQMTLTGQLRGNIKGPFFHNTINKNIILYRNFDKNSNIHWLIVDMDLVNLNITKYYYINKTCDDKGMIPPKDDWQIDKGYIGTLPSPQIVGTNIKEINNPPLKPEYKNTILEPELMDILRQYHSEY